MPLFLIQNSSHKSLLYKGEDNEIHYNPVFYLQNNFNNNNLHFEI